MMQVFQHHTARVPQRHSRCCIGDNTHIPSQGICVSFQRATVSCQQDGCFLVETKPAGQTMSWPPSCQQDGVEARNYPVDRTYRESISLQILLDIRPTKGSSCQQDDSPNKAGSDITEFLPHSDAVILSTGRSVPIFPSSWQQDDFILSRHPVNRMNQLCPLLILTTGWRCNRPYVHYGWKPHSGDGPPPPRSRLRQHPQTPPRAGFGVSGTSDFEVLP